MASAKLVNSTAVIGLLAALMVFAGGAALARPLEGKKAIYLVTAAGQEMMLGTVTFTPKGGHSEYVLALEDAPFTDHFLSMRPFKCIEGADETVCHLPYPYKLRRQVAGDDLTDLEHELLFLHKGAGEYGINFWNGIYYDLAVTEDGSIKGSQKAIDMNMLASPPAQDYVRLISKDDLVEVDGANRRFPTLVIR